MDTVLHQEEQNRKKGIITTTIVHIILLILAILPLLTFPDPPPGQPSVAISFGAPDVGQGEEEPAPSQAEVAEEDEPEAVEEPVEVEQPEEVVKEREVKEEKKKPKETKPKVDNTKKVTDDSNARKLKEEKKKRDAAKAAEKKAQQEADAAAAKAAKAKADAAAQAAADKKKMEDAKKKFDIFNGGKGEGKDGQGTTDKPGTQGTEDGKPDATKLSGEGSGTGDVEGFGGRGYTPAGPVKGNFQEVGTVRLKVCVDRNGKVLSAKQRLSGSTTQSPTLRKLAIANAKKYKFSKSELDDQCGYITYIFKLQ